MNVIILKIIHSSSYSKAIKKTGILLLDEGYTPQPEEVSYLFAATS